MQSKTHSLALRVCLIYCLMAGGWILLSDKILAWLVSDSAELSHLQTYKGWAFVVITALLLYWVLTQLLWEWEAETRKKSADGAPDDEPNGWQDELKSSDARPDLIELQLRRTVNAGTLMALLVMGFLGYTTWRDARMANANAQWVLRTHLVLQTTADTLGYVVDVESGARVYIISANPDLLEAYHRAVAGVPGKLAQLRLQTADNPEPQQRLDVLEKRVAATLDFMKRVVNVRDLEGADAAARLIESGEGKVLMDQVRDTLKAIREAEERLLQTREASFDAGNYWAAAVSLLGSLAGILFVGLAWMILVRRIRAEGWARAKVRALNEQLEQRVADRTAQLVRANDELRDRESLLHMVTDGARVGLILVNERRRYLYANAAYSEIYELDHASIIGRLMPTVLGQIYYEEVKPRLDRAFAGERVNDEVQLPPLAGGTEVRFFNVILEPRTQSPLGRHVVVMLVDVTERKRAEVTIRQERDFSNAVLNSLPGVVYCYNEQLQFRRWNKNLERVTGYSAKEIARMSPLDFFEEADREMIQARIREVFDRGASQVEAEFVTRDGRRLPYFFTGLVTEIDRQRCLVGVGIDITERRRAEQGLIESREQLRALLARLQRAQEEERIRVAREIHDELGQLLTGLKMDVRWLERKLSAPDLPPMLNPLLDRAVAASELADITIATVQKIAEELRPGVLDKLGLAAALTQRARSFQERTGIQCAVAVSESEITLLPEVATELFYICQEALTNVARHARARNVEICLRTAAEAIVLEIRDDGVGISELNLQDGRALGLLGMKERAASCQGTIVFRRIEKGGTQITVRIPRARASQKEING